MSSASATPPAVRQNMVVVVEYEKIQGTYLELGFWDEDIGAERYAELLHRGHIREEHFEGNLLLVHGQPDTAISLKNETIFRCYCAPDLQNCRACFMRKRTVFAEGQAQLARISRRAAKAETRRLKAEAGVLEAEVAALKSSAEKRDKELLDSNAQVLALKDYIASRFADEVQSLGAAHPLAEFQRAADKFESEGGNVGRSAQSVVSGHQAGRAPTPDAGADGGVQSGSPDRTGDLTDTDDEDLQDGLARKRRRISSAGPSRPPTSTAVSSSRRRRRSSPSGRRKVVSFSRPAALAVPASSGPELPASSSSSSSSSSALAAFARSEPEMQPSARRRKIPAAAAAAVSRPVLAAPASSGPEKTAGRSSWNSRSAHLDVAGPSSPAASSSTVASSAVASSAVASPSSSLKRKSPTPDTNPDTDSSADPSTDSDSDSDTNAPAPARRYRGNSWTEHEKLSLIATVGAHVAAVRAGTVAPVHDAALWVVLRDRLEAEHGIDRGAQACRMTWGRGLRERSGIDERFRKDPTRMATSLQKKAAGKKAAKN